VGYMIVMTGVVPTPSYILYVSFTCSHHYSDPKH